jgi:hypothetical protein
MIETIWAISSGYKQDTPDYERLINVVHDAALAAGKPGPSRKSSLTRRRIRDYLVDDEGFEPSTPALRTRCSPN